MDDFGVTKLETMMAFALTEGRALSLKLDGSDEWVQIDYVASEPKLSPLIEARRASDGRVIVFSPARIVALDVGEGPFE